MILGGLFFWKPLIQERARTDEPDDLAAADYVLIPALPEYLSLRGIAAFYETIDAVRRDANRNLEVFGILPTFYDSRTLHAQEVIEAMEKRDLPVLPTRVRRSVRVAETALAHETILSYAQSNPPAQAIAKTYRELAEIIDEKNRTSVTVAQSEGRCFMKLQI